MLTPAIIIFGLAWAIFVSSHLSRKAEKIRIRRVILKYLNRHFSPRRRTSLEIKNHLRACDERVSDVQFYQIMTELEDENLVDSWDVIQQHSYKFIPEIKTRFYQINRQAYRDLELRKQRIANRRRRIRW